MNRIALIPVLASLLLAAACSHKEAASSQAAPARVRITTAQAAVRNVPAEVRETGSFVADESADVAPLVAGRVLKTPANVGDFVKAGQVICELDHRDAQLHVDQARAQLAQATSALAQAKSRLGLSGDAGFNAQTVPEVAAAKAAYQSALAMAKQAAADARRYANLVETGDISRSAYEKAKTQQDAAEAQADAARQQYEGALNGARQGFGGVQISEAALEGARAQLAQAEKALADTTIRAPFDGHISARPVSPGDYVAVGKTVATVGRMDVLKLQLQTPEQRASRVRLGMTVKARVAAHPERDFEGKVTAINPAVDPGSRAFVIEARFENGRGELRPGMFSAARVLLPGGEDAVFVPRAAVIRDKTTDSYQAFVIENQTARLRVVAAGDAEGDSVRIASGLTGNETVATGNLTALFDGAQVEAAAR
jgi:multidrug efflux pump subunit AcrA (membrane-fusion protein)